MKKKNYEKKINHIINVIKNIECVNLSMGAGNRADFSWIVDNLEVFKKESIESYNAVISSISRQEKGKLYFIVQEQKDAEFSAVEKHLGIWHKFKGLSNESKSKDFYVSKNIRYAYINMDCLEIEQLSMLHCRILVFLKEDSEIDDFLKELTKGKNIFDTFYDKGHLLAEFRDLYTEGNAIIFFSKIKQDINDIIIIAEKEGFVAN